MTARILTLLLLLAAHLAARPQDDSPRAAEAWDVHVLQLVTAPGSMVPAAEIVASKRITAGSAEGEHAVHVRAGGRPFGAEFRRGHDGKLRLEREIGNQRYTSSSSRSIEVTEPSRWGRRPRQGGNARGAILCERVGDGSKPFVALEPRGFMQHLVDLFFTAEPPRPDTRNFFRFKIKNHLQGVPDQVQDEIERAQSEAQLAVQNWLSPKWTAARVLGSVPLREYLDAAQVDRILAAATLVPKSMPIDEHEWPLLRPLIALGHRPTLERLARVPDEDEADPDQDSPHAREDVVMAPYVPTSIEDSVMVAYATATDPEIRGLAGWVATGTRATDVYDTLIQDVQSGRAVLPGDAARRDLMASHLVHSRAWQSITSPLLTLLGSAAAIAAIMVLLRAAVRRMM